MPFLRFSRDKRGYENTYLCHTFRQSGRQSLRVLYWFRTPPDVKVGRLALDPGVIRAIEENNPKLKFDWGKILKVKPPPASEHGTDGRKKSGGRRRTDGTARTAQSFPPGGGVSSGEQRSEPEVPLSGELSKDPLASDPGLDSVSQEKVPLGQLDRGGESAVPEERGNVHVALSLTDEEGLARLRARHSEIQARINERIRDQAQLEALRAQAGLIDPDAWRTVDEARERLASLDVTVEAIRRVLGRRRRRRRGRPSGHGGAGLARSNADGGDAVKASPRVFPQDRRDD